MDLTATQEVIVSLKKVKDEQQLSVPQIKKMVDATGAYLSLTTLRRVFAENSEEDSFNYEATIRPIAQALLANNELTEDAGVRAQIEGYLAIIRHKDETIESLHRQIDALKEDTEARCREYDKRMAFLRDQIELKDRRMDEQAEIRNKLFERINLLTDAILERF